MNCHFSFRLQKKFRCGTALLSLVWISLIPHLVQAQVSANRPAGGAYITDTQPAASAILKAFRSFEVVAMPAAHGEKDMDDFILSLVRDPRFPDNGERHRC